MTALDMKSVGLSPPETWVDRYGNILFRYAVLRLRDKTVAEDMVQETFLGALRNQDAYNHQSSEQNWLFGILKHKIIDYFRKAKREQPVDNPDADINYNNTFFNDKGMWVKGPAEWKQNPGSLAEQSEFYRIFSQCLKKLPKRIADAFMLREIDGLKGAEICQVLGISANNYWIMLHRARLQLRACLEENWLTGGPSS